jgi:hypothetical protein
MAVKRVKESLFLTITESLETLRGGAIAIVPIDSS